MGYLQLGADPWYSYTAVGTGVYAAQRSQRRKIKRRARAQIAAAAETERRRAELLVQVDGLVEGVEVAGAKIDVSIKASVLHLQTARRRLAQLPTSQEVEAVIRQVTEAESESQQVVAQAAAIENGIVQPLKETPPKVLEKQVAVARDGLAALKKLLPRASDLERRALTLLAMAKQHESKRRSEMTAAKLRLREDERSGGADMGYLQLGSPGFGLFVEKYAVKAIKEIRKPKVMAEIRKTEAQTRAFEAEEAWKKAEYEQKLQEAQRVRTKWESKLSEVDSTAALATSSIQKVRNLAGSELPAETAAQVDETLLQWEIELQSTLAGLVGLDPNDQTQYGMLGSALALLNSLLMRARGLYGRVEKEVTAFKAERASMEALKRRQQELERQEQAARTGLQSEQEARARALEQDQRRYLLRVEAEREALLAEEAAALAQRRTYLKLLEQRATLLAQAMGRSPYGPVMTASTQALLGYGW